MEYIFIPDYEALDVERRVLDEYNALDTSILERTSPPISEIPLLKRSQPLMRESYVEPRLSFQQPSSVGMKIPRMIVQVCQERTTLVDALSNSVKDFMPTWNYVLLTEAEADKFVQQVYPDFYPTYTSYKYWEQKRNAVVFLWLHKNGGFYIDINYRMMADLEPKLPMDAELCVMQSPDLESYYTNSLFGGVAQHPLWKACIEEMRTLARSPPKWSITKELHVSVTTGTIMFSSLLNKVNSSYYVLPVSSIAPRSVCGNKVTRESGVLYQTYSCDNPQGIEQWFYNMYVCNSFWLYIIIIIVMLLLVWLLVKCINYFYRPKKYT